MLLAVVMLATVGNAPRIKELLDIAKETKEEVIKSKEKKSNMFEESIEPLFRVRIKMKRFIRLIGIIALFLIVVPTVSMASFSVNLHVYFAKRYSCSRHHGRHVV